MRLTAVVCESLISVVETVGTLCHSFVTKSKYFVSALVSVVSVMYFFSNLHDQLI